MQGVAAVAGPTSSKSVEPRPSSPPDTFPRGCDQLPSGDCQRPDAPVPREEGPQELHRPAVSVPVLRTWLDAAKDGDVRQLAALLRAYPDLLNTRAGGLGAGALHWAAAKGHTDAVGLLLAAGADVLSTTTTRATPLHAAAGAGRSEACELLLAAAGPAAAAALLSAANEDGQTPAALALQHGHRMTHSMLVSAAEAMHVDAMGGASPLAHPSQSDVMQTAGLLLSRGQRWRPSVSHGWQRADGGGSALISDSDSSSEWVEEAEGEGDAGDASEAGDKHTTSGAGGHDRADGPLLQQGAAAPIKAAAPLDRSLGRAWLDAARAGDVARLASLLSAAPELLLYRGEGCSYAVIGNSALHWAAANGHHGALTWLLERLGSEVSECFGGEWESGTVARAGGRGWGLVHRVDKVWGQGETVPVEKQN